MWPVPKAALKNNSAKQKSIVENNFVIENYVLTSIKTFLPCYSIISNHLRVETLFEFELLQILTRMADCYHNEGVTGRYWLTKNQELVYKETVWILLDIPTHKKPGHCCLDAFTGQPPAFIRFVFV